MKASKFWDKYPQIRYFIGDVRDKSRFVTPELYASQIKVIEVDLSEEDHLLRIPMDIDLAYYLVHSMTMSGDEFDSIEKRCAENFSKYILNNYKSNYRT